ncbi:MAG TPA: hypothetical protein DEH78_09015 [Solibacterales bacterium]|nr:hypothetical protein [Bryobacterales bacterium]
MYPWSESIPLGPYLASVSQLLQSGSDPAVVMGQIEVLTRSQLPTVALTLSLRLGQSRTLWLRVPADPAPNPATFVHQQPLASKRGTHGQIAVEVFSSPPGPAEWLKATEVLARLFSVYADQWLLVEQNRELAHARDQLARTLEEHKLISRAAGRV